MENIKISEQKKILGVIEDINALWLNKKYDEIGEYLSENVVVARPGSTDRAHGKEIYVQSYRDYDTVAKTHKYILGDPAIDIMDNTAVAIVPFKAKYEINGKIYNEEGRNIFMFSRSENKWFIVWRTMQIDDEK
jgi:Domain of unknown function (DUF4440)